MNYLSKTFSYWSPYYDTWLDKPVFEMRPECDVFLFLIFIDFMEIMRGNWKYNNNVTVFLILIISELFLFMTTVGWIFYYIYSFLHWCPYFFTSSFVHVHCVGILISLCVCVCVRGAKCCERPLPPWVHVTRPVKLKGTLPLIQRNMGITPPPTYTEM